MQVDSSGSALGCCEQDNETPGSIKCGEFLDRLRGIQLLKRKLFYGSPSKYHVSSGNH